MPETSTPEKVQQAAQDLIATLQNPQPKSPFLTFGKDQHTALQHLADIFQSNLINNKLPPLTTPTNISPPRVDDTSSPRVENTSSPRVVARTPAQQLNPSVPSVEAPLHNITQQAEFILSLTYSNHQQLDLKLEQDHQYVEAQGYEIYNNKTCSNI